MLLTPLILKLKHNTALYLACNSYRGNLFVCMFELYKSYTLP